MAELGRIEKVSHLRIFTRRIKIRKFMISCCGNRAPVSNKGRICVFLRNKFNNSSSLPD